MHTVGVSCWSGHGWMGGVEYFVHHGCLSCGLWGHLYSSHQSNSGLYKLNVMHLLLLYAKLCYSSLSVCRKHLKTNTGRGQDPQNPPYKTQVCTLQNHSTPSAFPRPPPKFCTSLVLLGVTSLHIYNNLILEVLQQQRDFRCMPGHTSRNLSGQS